MQSPGSKNNKKWKCGRPFCRSYDAKTELSRVFAFVLQWEDVINEPGSKLWIANKNYHYLSKVKSCIRLCQLHTGNQSNQANSCMCIHWLHLCNFLLRQINFRSAFERVSSLSSGCGSLGKNAITVSLYRVVQKPVNVNPGLNVNWSIIFSCLKMFFTSDVWCSLRLLQFKTEGQTI